MVRPLTSSCIGNPTDKISPASFCLLRLFRFGSGPPFSERYNSTHGQTAPHTAAGRNCFSWRAGKHLGLKTGKGSEQPDRFSLQFSRSARRRIRFKLEKQSVVGGQSYGVSTVESITRRVRNRPARQTGQKASRCAQGQDFKTFACAETVAPAEARVIRFRNSRRERELACLQLRPPAYRADTIPGTGYPAVLSILLR